MQNQKGISTLAVIVSIVVVAVVAIGGVFAWQYLKTNNQLLSEQRSQNQEQQTVNQQTNNIQPIDQATNYFEIKEVGLNFKITDDIKDLTYSIINEDNGVKYVRFSTKSLEDLGGKKCNSDQGAIGAIGITSQEISGAMAVTYLIKSNNFYVIYGAPQIDCSNLKAAQDLQHEQLISLQQALKTIAKINN